MRRSWLTSMFRKWGRQPARPARFAPRVHTLEDRAVPATFFVDPDATAGNPMFDDGRPDAFTGPFKTGGDGSVYNSLADAIADANANPGPDTIRLSYETAQIFFVNSAPDTPVAITDSLSIIGSGPGASVVQTDPTNNQPTAVFTVQSGVTADFSNLTLYGGASGYDASSPTGGDVTAPNSITGRFVRYEAGSGGTISNAVITGIFANGFGGIGIAATGTGTNVTVQNSTFANMGAVGVAASAGANVNLFGNTYTGKGAGNYSDIFAQITDGATAVISGNTVTNNNGIIGVSGEESAAVVVAAGGGAAVPLGNVSIFGNSLSGNYNGVFVGSGATDTSNANIQYNNLNDDVFGVQTNRMTGSPNVNAPNNYWGGTGGPFNAKNNPTGTGSNVSDDVAFTPPRTTPAVVAAAPTLPTYLANVTQVSVQAGTDAAEPGTAGSFTLTRTTGGDTGSALTVNYTVSGTATNGTDYTMLTGTATFAAGSTTATIAVTPIDDALVEGTETVVVTLAPGTGYTPTGGPAQIALFDNDVTPPAVGVEQVTDAAEPATAGALRFTRSGDTSGSLTVNYTVTGTATAGTDYTALSGSVTFAAGQATVDVPVTPIDDTQVEGTETVVATITASPSYTIAGGSAQVNILDNDVAPQPVGVQATADATEPATAGNFRLTRTGDLTGPLTVNYTVGGSAVAGTDYAALPGSVTFAAGSPTADVAVTPISRPGFQGTRTVTLTLTPNATYDITSGSATVNILDNEAAAPAVTVSRVSDAAEPSTAGTFQFTRVGDTSGPLTVNYTVGGTATNGTDYTTLPGTVTFTAGQATATVDVTPIDDTQVEGSETVILTLTADPAYTIAGGSAQITIADDDVAAPAPPQVSVLRVGDAAEPSTAGTLRFTRTGDTTAPLTLSYTVGGTATPGVDYQALSGTVTFAAGSATADVTVTPIDDTDFEGAETVDVTITPGAGFTVGGGTATVSILDNDTAPPPLPVVSVTTTANAAEPSTNGNFRFTRSGDTTGTLTVIYAISGTATAGTDYQGLPGTVTFAAGQTTVDVPVTVIDDKALEPSETVTVTVLASPAFSGGGAATVNIADNDTPPKASVAVGGPTDGSVLVFTPDQATGKLPTSGTAIGLFNGFSASIRTATADVDGDGFLDTIMVSGPGAPVVFAIVSGKDNVTTLVPPTDPFGSGFTGGAFVAAGDLNGDGRAEFAFTPDQGGGPNVVIYSLNTNGSLSTPRAFFALGNPGFRGGARPAVGDVNGDGIPDLAVGAGFLGGPNVEIHNGKSVANGDFTTLIGSGFFAFPGSDAETLRNGVFLAIGDVNGDGFGDLIAGGGPGGGPRVLVLDGKLLSANNVNGAYAAPDGNFFFGNGADRGGVRVASKDVDGDGKSDIVVGSGEGLPAQVRIYFGSSVKSSGEPSSFQDLTVFSNQVLTGGVFVG